MDDFWFKTPILTKDFDIWDAKNKVLFHLNRKIGDSMVTIK